MRLDDICESWTSDGISNVKFDFEQNKASFNLSKSQSTVAIVQSRIDCLYYKEWSIGPVKDGICCKYVKKIHNEALSNQSDAVELSLLSSQFRIRIQVLGTYCYLIEPSLHQLKDILNKAHTPEKLLSILSTRGIHILPSKCNATNTDNSSLKKKEIDDRFCEDASLLCFAFDIKSSPHNADLDASKAMYIIKESDVFTGSSDIFPMYQMMMEFDENMDSAEIDMNTKELRPMDFSHKVFCSIIDPNDVNSNKRLDEPSQTISLYPLFSLDALCSPEAYQRVTASSPCTSDTMKRLLKLINLTSFCSLGKEYGV
jgi:hypothetical protein